MIQKKIRKINKYSIENDSFISPQNIKIFNNILIKKINKGIEI